MKSRREPPNPDQAAKLKRRITDASPTEGTPPTPTEADRPITTEPPRDDHGQFRKPHSSK